MAAAAAVSSAFQEKADGFACFGGANVTPAPANNTYSAGTRQHTHERKQNTQHII